MFEPIIFLVGGGPIYWRVVSIIPCLYHSGCDNVRYYQVFHGEQKPSQLRTINYTSSTIWKLIGFILIWGHLVNIAWSFFSLLVIWCIFVYCVLFMLIIRTQIKNQLAQWKVFKYSYVVPIFDAHILTLQALNYCQNTDDT